MGDGQFSRTDVLITPAVPADLKGASRVVDSDTLTVVSHQDGQRRETQTVRVWEGSYESEQDRLLQVVDSYAEDARPVAG